ncbi:hypothetical protein MRS44_001368 [Fusarium solani]|uniref:uncharacterized protein n=1 Tax=Fusarium solani TaxID=169388 RepID=UPI0032C4B181|nr:hypothetical protein MRS44_001368 [Fusarium solani]
MHYFQILFASLLGTATAQQLPEYKYDYDFRPSEGITPTCKAALNKVLDCDTLLARYGPENITPSVEQATKICTATCYSSLVQFKKDIQKACPVESNIVHWPDGSNFTGTDNINEFIDREWVDSREAGKFGYQRCSDCVLGLYQIQEESKAEYDENFASVVADYIDTCETTSVDPHILKGTPTATGTSSSTGNSGAETTPVATDTSTEVTPSPSPEIPVLTPMPSANGGGFVKTREETSASSSKTQYMGNPILPRMSNGWAGFANRTQSVTTPSLAQSTATSSGGMATLMTIRFKDKNQLQKVL